MKIIRLIVVAAVMPLAGCTGMISTMTAKDTRWSKSGAEAPDLERDYRVCRASASQLYTLDMSLLKGGAIHSAALDCLREQKGWNRDEHGWIVPATGFK